jgi:hypothetical protein
LLSEIDQDLAIQETTLRIVRLEVISAGKRSGTTTEDWEAGRVSS